MADGFGQWPVDEPSASFADRVMGAVMSERSADADVRAGGGKRRIVYAVAALLLLALPVGLWLRSPVAENGSAEAGGERIERTVAGRATAVLEPGARIDWQ